MAELTAEQQSSQAEEAARKFREQVFARGGAVVNENGATVKKRGGTVSGHTEILGAQTPAQDPRRSAPTFIDIDIDDESSRIIHLHSRKHGIIEIEVPVPTTGMARKMGWYQAQLQKVHEEMQRTSSEKEADRLDRRLGELQEAMVRQALPAFPHGLLDDLGMKALRKIMEVVEQMVAESMGSMANPLGYMRDLYTRIGSPHGADDEGLERWIRERFADLEEQAPPKQ